ncbi:MAG: lytic transglycosylase domain-containing protein [Gemmatimonadota bacterium]|nr:lytic transglycosylase domain-containing protein [Gemmatimonadota bacterium]MDH4350289.1 lytic transglycosylase domain-containing protein [Gemmatimonadota bacterium]MDH5197834.1 lytic transglycosylase domain-containing protein [Gemmatimonadota bacterium]
MITDEYRIPLHVTQRLMLRGVGLFVVLLAAGATISLLPGGAEAKRETGVYTGIVGNLRELRSALDQEHGEAELQRLRAERAEAILALSKQHPVPVGLAETIFDEALRAGIAPQLAFEIVRLESRFNPDAVSSVGAIGLAQVMPRTAILYDSTLTRDDLFDPTTNLRIGFRFFGDLLERYDYDLRLALLAYNRGPQRVGDIMARGGNPANGYADRILANYGAPTGPIRQ